MCCFTMKSVVAMLLACTACGEFSAAPEVKEEGPTSPITTTHENPPPVSKVVVPPSQPPVTTLSQACTDAVRDLQNAQNRSNVIKHFTKNVDLADALAGKWYACGDTGLFDADGIWLQSDQTTTQLKFNGQTFTFDGPSGTWGADSALDDGTRIVSGVRPLFAVISNDGSKAIMGPAVGASAEWVFVRVE